MEIRIYRIHDRGLESTSTGTDMLPKVCETRAFDSLLQKNSSMHRLCLTEDHVHSMSFHYWTDMLTGIYRPVLPLAVCSYAESTDTLQTN